MKKVLIGASSVLSLVLLSGCSSLVATKVDSNVGYLVQFSGSDFNIGDVVSAEMPYDAKNPDMTAMVLNKAIVDNKCDTLLLPRYEIIPKTFGKNLIRVTGRVATFKIK
ncbi:hypothetical protein [Helicobacter trogontum]|uniref:Lipoprotein n=1 Tax=Helicobacter trogontum TaxID=50960 RepID=A0A4U8TBU0_9HELI|nr:hypothetical protein [Helicobacter trogontum]MCI5786625.1 hypothetical protein [Helicobacter trogontum]MDY5184630.1 hypothetical protein [Helicobacter trogontum]TLD97134.1 hypothetical protein LS80_007115 [Helicobacter trogontum]